MGALFTVIGLALLTGAARAGTVRETAVLGGLTALAVAAVDLVFSLNGTVSSIYMADAVVEAVLLAAWLIIFPSVGRNEP